MPVYEVILYMEGIMVHLNSAVRMLDIAAERYGEKTAVEDE